MSNMAGWRKARWGGVDKTRAKKMEEVGSGVEKCRMEEGEVGWSKARQGG